MTRTPCRITQLSCAVTALLGFLPWGLLLAAATLQAIESPAPLTMSFAVWLVLLVPIWVVWFGVVAWNKRHESVMPAVLMAVPAIVVTAMMLALPIAQSAP